MSAEVEPSEEFQERAHRVQCGIVGILGAIVDVEFPDLQIGETLDGSAILQGAIGGVVEYMVCVGLSDEEIVDLLDTARTNVLPQLRLAHMAAAAGSPQMGTA